MIGSPFSPIVPQSFFLSDSQMMNYFHLAGDLALVPLRAIPTIEFLSFLRFFFSDFNYFRHYIASRSTVVELHARETVFFFLTCDQRSYKTQMIIYYISICARVKQLSFNISRLCTFHRISILIGRIIFRLIALKQTI